MYTTTEQRLVDQQTMMGRFYSMRSQGNSSSGGDFESLNTLSSLGDEKALDQEKLFYMRENFKRIHGRYPDPLIHRYSGQFPAYENTINAQYNPQGRFTAPELSNLGEVLYKGIKSLVGLGGDPIAQVRQIAEQNRKLASRFSLIEQIIVNQGVMINKSDGALPPPIVIPRSAVKFHSDVSKNLVMKKNQPIDFSPGYEEDEEIKSDGLHGSIASQKIPYGGYNFGRQDVDNKNRPPKNYLQIAMESDIIVNTKDTNDLLFVPQIMRAQPPVNNHLPPVSGMNSYRERDRNSFNSSDQDSQSQLMNNQ